MMRRPSFLQRFVLIAGFFLLGPTSSVADAVPSPLAASRERVAEYRAERAKGILDLQQYRTEESGPVETARGSGVATLVQLNPAVNAWLLLTLDDGQRTSFHLENADPASRSIGLSHGGGAAHLVIADARGERTCAPWTGTPSALQVARDSARPYAPLCNGLLFLRNPVRGSRTGLEWTTDFLRDEVWGGEAVVGFMRRNFFRDLFAEHGSAPSGLGAGAAPAGDDRPAPAATDPAAADMLVKPGTLGIALDGAPAGDVRLGSWYPATGLPGISVSAVRPNVLAPAILTGARMRVNALDPVESAALDYLVAFDLGDFDLGFEAGTDHPRLGWSPRTLDAVRDPALPGPDGIVSAAPLVTTGMISPAHAADAVATFTGGFKREHSAFKYGPLALKNHGSHYGFVEEGVVLSKLQPGLATILVRDDGTVAMKTWTEADEAMLGRIRYARQNGVALIEPDPVTGLPAPGAFVNKWGAGNWSGSADESLRTLRAGACLHEQAGRRFLIYAYFSTATPSAMARVFQAYGCNYAMQLDINALEHTYLAVYVRHDGEAMVQHLVQGMAQLDKTVGGRLVPRFLGYPDNRDFFYLTRRRTPR